MHQDVDHLWKEVTLAFLSLLSLNFSISVDWSISIAGPSFPKAMSAAWFSGSKSVKSTNFLSSIFFRSVSERGGGVKGLGNDAPGLGEEEFIPVCTCCDGMMLELGTAAGFVGTGLFAA